MKIKLFFIFTLSFYLNVFSQDSLKLNGEVEISSYAFNKNLPFWLHTNSGGSINSKTNIAGRAQLYTTYSISKKHQLLLGLGGFYRDEAITSFQRNDLFLSYKNRMINVTLGSREVLDKFQGIGVVRDNFTLSGNARALPGLKIEFTKPLKVLSNIYVNGAIAHYNLNDNRFISDTRVHNKKLEVIWNYKPNSSWLLGLEHFAQWGGISPELGKQPSSFNDFISVFFARKASDNASTSDQNNALGNSLGHYKLEYKYTDDSSEYLLYHHHPFEDGSGTALRNFPDGIWGFYYSLKADGNYTSILKGFLVEYVSTVSQSGRFGRSGRDNYFRNGIYRSGWTYENNIIGLPFISVPDNTRVEAFHLGIILASGKWESRLKSSYVRSLGTFINPFSPIVKQLFLATKHTYTINESSLLRLDLGYDVITTTQDNFGAGVSYIYKL